MHLDGHLPIDQHSAAASFNFGQIDEKEERSWTDGSRQLGAVAGAAAAGVGREGAGAEGPAGEVAIDVVAAAGVHTAARVGRRAAPAPLHSSNGSYDDTASVAVVVDGRYTTLFTGTYSSSSGDADADGLLLDCFSCVPPACSFHGQGITY